MEGYSTKVDFTSDLKDVFIRINDIPKWWLREAAGIMTEFEGESSNLNDEFILRHSDVHYSKHKLTELIPYKRIVWRVTESKLNWIKGNKQEWDGTKMIFELISNEEKTTLIFTHLGLVPELECYEHCVHFWERLIKEWLFNFINEGK